MTSKFDPKKPVETRDGKSARIICTDRIRDDSIIALVLHSDCERIRTYREDGSYFTDQESGLDLINITKKITRWLNVYMHEDKSDIYTACLWDTEDAAITGKVNDASYIKTIKIEVELPLDD